MLQRITGKSITADSVVGAHVRMNLIVRLVSGFDATRDNIFAPEKDSVRGGVYGTGFLLNLSQSRLFVFGRDDVDFVEENPFFRGFGDVRNRILSVGVLTNVQRVGDDFESAFCEPMQTAVDLSELTGRRSGFLFPPQCSYSPCAALAIGRESVEGEAEAARVMAIVRGCGRIGNCGKVGVEEFERGDVYLLPRGEEVPIVCGDDFAAVLIWAARGWDKKK